MWMCEYKINLKFGVSNFQKVFIHNLVISKFTLVFVLILDYEASNIKENYCEKVKPNNFNNGQKMSVKTVIQGVLAFHDFTIHDPRKFMIFFQGSIS